MTLNKGNSENSTNSINSSSDKKMVLEVAVLNVIAGQEDEFVKAFAKAQTIISKMAGYISHQLQRCIENTSRFILLVEWEKLSDHTEGFRKSDGYQEWKKLLHHFYDPFPTVEHYEDVRMCEYTDVQIID